MTETVLQGTLLGQRQEPAQEGFRQGGRSRWLSVGTPHRQARRSRRGGRRVHRISGPRAARGRDRSGRRRLSDGRTRHGLRADDHRRLDRFARAGRSAPAGVAVGNVLMLREIGDPRSEIEVRSVRAPERSGSRRFMPVPKAGGDRSAVMRFRADSRRDLHARSPDLRSPISAPGFLSCAA